jgi:hypothetical protein
MTDMSREDAEKGDRPRRVTDKNGEIVPFGKYKGQPVERMMADAGYCEWALAQPWFREKFAALFAIIVNGGAARDADTPEHNRMQTLFLDPEMCVAAYRAIVSDHGIDKRIRESVWDGDGVRAARANAEKVENERRYASPEYRALAAEAEYTDKLGKDASAVSFKLFSERDAAEKKACDLVRRQAEAAAEKARSAKAILRSALELAAAKAAQEVYDAAAAKVRNPAKEVVEAARKARDDAWDAHRAACRAKEAASETIAADARAAGEAAARDASAAIIASGKPAVELYAHIAGKTAQFETNGWDVAIAEPNWRFPAINIELKPTIGDDYPSILRAVQRRGAYSPSGASTIRALIVDRFDAEGATYDQVTRMFAASGIAVRTLAEIMRLKDSAS